jgi:hypothetical protein
MNTRFWIILTLLLGSSLVLKGQKFSVEVSIRKVTLGHTIEVTYHIEDLSGDFKPPKFTGFDVVGGPNHTSSFSLMFGKMSQSQSYTYRLRPKSEGTLLIEPAFLHLENDVLHTDPIEITVQPNPNGIPESIPHKDKHNKSLDGRQQNETPKSKRPITKL